MSARWTLSERQISFFFIYKFFNKTSSDWKQTSLTETTVAKMENFPAHPPCEKLIAFSILNPQNVLLIFEVVFIYQHNM